MNYKKLVYRLLSRTFIPEEALDIKGMKLLHISDTPTSIYGDLQRLIRKLKPEYIVHTGDLVDNLKLELYPSLITQYEKYVRKIIGILESSGAKKIYIAKGNHDDQNLLNDICILSHIIKKSEKVYIEGIEFKISHYAEEIIRDPGHYNLFGHDLTIIKNKEKHRLYFNGIPSMNVIDLKSGKTYYLKYPWGTDSMRLGQGKMGL